MHAHGEFASLVIEAVRDCVGMREERLDGLTSREREIAAWVVEGKTNREIGVILGISPRTVQKHLEHVFAKVGVPTRAALVAGLVGGARRIVRRVVGRRWGFSWFFDAAAPSGLRARGAVAGVRFPRGAFVVLIRLSDSGRASCVRAVLTDRAGPLGSGHRDASARTAPTAGS